MNSELMKSILLTGVFLTCFFSSMHSSAFRQDEYAIEISPASQDLSQSSVVDIFQDSNDFIWLLTQEGLNRFDGYTVVSFRTDRSDETSISNQVTTNMAEDGNKTLWIGTLGGGLNRFNEASLSFTSYKARPSITNKNPISNMISSLSASQDGSLWVGYANGSGFSRFDSTDESFVHYFLPNQIPSAIVKAFAETADGTLYIAITGSGLYRMSATTQVVAPVAKQLTDDSTALPIDITDMILLDSGSLLITSFSDGAFLYDPAKNTLAKHPIHTATPAETANQILTVMEDAEGNHWFGTDAGIVVYSPSGSATWLTSVNTQLPEATVTAILQSRSGMLWIGTFSGLAQGTRSLFQKFTEEDGLSSSVTYSIATDNDENWWIGTSRGITAIRPERDASGAWAITTPVDTLLEGYEVTTIAKQGSTIWAGSLNTGFFEVDLGSKSITQFTADGEEGSLSENGVPVVKAMPDGRILVGTYGGGLNIYDPQEKSFQVLVSQSNDGTTISDDRVLSLLIDAHEQVWVGTQDGLNLFDPNNLTFRRFKFDPEDTTTLSSNTVFSLAEDNNGVLWIGTRSGGLNFLKIDAAQDRSPRFHQLPPDVGVPSADILGILVDQQDNLWISHNAGITRIDGSRQHSVSFDVTAGLQAREFNQGAAHVGADGSLFFGGQFGFNVIEPEKSYDDSFEPKIQVTSFKLLNEHMYFDAP
ncbi:ligand-binding sensor domain-containing protein, partial [Congregibacter sp.]|uniref:ligand-binding sensor domain-containing protein n=1 Tax=Congregibacter sp. TaxID=2744308 RepID=UPI0039E587C3